jgi:hypothetical protein
LKLFVCGMSLTRDFCSFSVAVDGAMLASRDFGFMLVQGIFTMLLQIFLLSTSWCSNISAIFATFTIRLGSYSVGALIRAALGFGSLGIALRSGNVINGANNNGSAIKTQAAEAPQ